MHLVGVPRPNKSLETAYPIVTIEIPQIDISSTTVRNRITHGETTKFLISDAVREYIREEKLYEA